MESRIF